MATIFVEGQPHTVAAGQNLLQAVLGLGFDLPYFCWHPALGSVGACRQCAVKLFKDEQDERGRIVMACMTPVADGQRLSIRDPEVVAFRRAVLEWLMTNHPHDCPICDEGGECHLQDMTVMTGHTYRRHRFRKRTFRDQDLGPFLNHEMNRCIQCFRCVRFYQDYAGGRDLQALGVRNQTYFGRYADGPLENPFSGNLVEVCPTGVFTDKTFQAHYTRPWDLQTAPSVCIHCGLGCNTLLGERDGMLRRVRNRYHGAVNGYFLCDRGRFGYGFVHGAERVTEARIDGTAAGAEEALRRTRALLAAGGVWGIGSPRASLEANHALRALVGAERFCNGLEAREAERAALVLRILREGDVEAATLAEVETADAVLVLGEDLTQTAPRLDLALRQAARRQPARRAAALEIPAWDAAFVRIAAGQAPGPVYLLTPAATELDRFARRAWRGAPAEIARLGHAIAHRLDAQAPAPPELAPEANALAEEIAGALREAERPVVIAGLGSGEAALLRAAANTAWALARCRAAAGGQESRGADRAPRFPARLCLTVPEANTLGVALLARRGVDALREALAAGEVQALLVLENDLERRDPMLLDDLAERGVPWAVLDHSETETTRRATAVLPVATFAEASGAWVSNEGRLQCACAVHLPAPPRAASWRWLAALRGAAPSATAGARDLGSATGALERLRGELAREAPLFAPLAAMTAQALERTGGRPVPRQSHRASGRTAIHAQRSVSEPRRPEDPDAPLAYSMEGYPGQPPAALVTRYWAPGWNSVQALNKSQEGMAGPLCGDEGGVRLLVPGRGGARYFTEVPAPFVAPAGRWRALPRHRIFGSEELSARAEPIAARAPRAYAELSPAAAAALGVGPDAMVEVAAAGERGGARVWRLPVRISRELPEGTVGVTVGLAGGPAGALPEWVVVRVSENRGRR